MDPLVPPQRPRSRESDISSLEVCSRTFPVEETHLHNENSPSAPVSPRQGALQSPHGTLQQQDVTEHIANQLEPHAETSLLNEDESTRMMPTNVSFPARWNALGVFAICVLVLGTIGIVMGIALLAHIWRSSMRAQAGHIDNGQLWDLIIHGDWTSVTVTVTAAVIRVCLGFHMGILTGMIASLLIERTGVPMISVPLISMLRAVSTSPYNLASRKTLTTPFAVAIGLAIFLTGASNFTSTALLIDFKNTNITAPQRTIISIYGSSQPEEGIGIGTVTDLSDSSGVGTLKGSKIWNSHPNTYFRFAEHKNASVPDVDVDIFEDSGTALRAILPFAGVVDRTNLRRYEGPSVVFDSRVVCTRPKLPDMDIVFSAMVQNLDARASVLANRFDDLTIGGTFRIPRSTALFNPDYWPLWEGRPFKCIASAPKAAEEAKYWPISICSAGGGPSTKASQYVEVPQLLSTVLPVPNHKTSTFLIFNTTGQIEDWRRYLRTNGGTGDQEGSASAKQLNWTVSEEGTWVHFRPPSGSINASVSISTCFTNLPGVYQNVSMSSDHNGFEPSLSWDRDNSLYDTALIRDQYMNFGDSRSSPHLRGILDLHPKSSWELRDGMKPSEMTDSSQTLNYWMLFNSVAGGLHYVNLNGASDKYEVLAGGILLPGAFSPYAVHFAHAALFQDIIKTTNSLSQALQALFTVLRQMAYYENSPYFNNESSAVIIMSSDKLIPTQWTGFIVVAVTIAAHLILLTIITVLFLRWTKASWLGNVWASSSQVVSSETEDLIDKSTDKNDRAVEKIIMAGTSGAGGKLTYRVRVKRNEVNGRNELSLI